MSEPFLSEIRIFSFEFAPKGWALCNGQLLPINQNQALFSLLGTTYGGDGRVNFALPDLRGRAPVHSGAGISLGERAGEEAHTLSMAELSAHTHLAAGSGDTATLNTPTNNVWAKSDLNPYTNELAALSPMTAGLVGNTGGSQPHNNMQPYLVLSFCIALQGIFPSQN